MAARPARGGPRPARRPLTPDPYHDFAADIRAYVGGRITRKEFNRRKRRFLARIDTTVGLPTKEARPMNRFKVGISIVGMVQVMISAALATQALQPPIYTLPPVVALCLLIANAGLIYLAAQMPSWAESGRADRAIERDARDREPDRI